MNMRSVNCTKRQTRPLVDYYCSKLKSAFKIKDIIGCLLKLHRSIFSRGY